MMINDTGGEGAFEITGSGLGTGKFTDPFLLPSSQYMPLTMNTAMDYCLFLYFIDPNYRQATKRVVSHFINPIDFTGDSGDQKERDDFNEWLTDDLDVNLAMLEMGEEWACFEGSTMVPTLEGVFAIKELAGKTAHVINRNGQFVPARFSSYGVQRLFEVTLKDGQKFLVTPDHRWEVKDGKGHRVTRRTKDLKLSHVIPRSFYDGRPDKNSDYYDGVRHGFIFGDGCRENQHKPCQTTRACFFGDKDKAMYPFFEDHHNAIRPRTDEKRYEANFQCGHPGNYKELPEATASASYWYGFVSGFIAADGNVDCRDGCVTISQARRWVLSAVKDQLPRIGIVATSLGGPYEHEATFTKRDGSKHSVDSEYFTLRLMRNSMVAEDFLIPAHRDNFEANCNTESPYGEYVGIRCIKDTEQETEVFCCEEPQTHTFTIGNGVLTGNCYGNSFWRISTPFDRYLTDFRDGRFTPWALSMFPQELIKYNWAALTYTVPDPREVQRGRTWEQAKKIDLNIYDWKSTDRSRVKLRKIDPRRVILWSSWMSGKEQVIYRFEEQFIRMIKESKLFQVNETPLVMLQAISRNEDFMFNIGEVFHFKAPTISGISYHGWGLPEVMANFRSLHQLMVYRRIDESVGMDYILPWRIFSPNLGGKADDLMSITDMGYWKQAMAEMIARNRKDPFAVQALPFPVHYQEANGSGKELVPKDLIEFQTNSMLDGYGYPAELFRGTMQLEEMPAAIKIMENSFRFLYSGNNKFVKWVTRSVLDYLQMAQMKVKVQLPSIATDMEIRTALLQLAAGGDVSRETAYRLLNISDPIEEAKTRMREDAELQEASQKIQQDAARKIEVGSIDDLAAAEASQGSDPGGAAGAPPMGQSGMTPMDVQQKSVDMANQWAQIPDNGTRAKAMRQAEATDYQTYALAKQLWDDMKSQGASDGRKAVTSGQAAQPQ
jgi:hypothetical protein